MVVSTHAEEVRQAQGLVDELTARLSQATEEITRLRKVRCATSNVASNLAHSDLTLSESDLTPLIHLQILRTPLQDLEQALQREHQATSRCDELAATLQQHSEQGLAQGKDNADPSIDGTDAGAGAGSTTVVAASVALLTDQVASLTHQLDTLTQQATHRDHLLRSLEESHAITAETLRQSDLKIGEMSAQKQACEKRLASVQKETDKLAKALERTHKVHPRS